jgi:chitinase
VLALTLWTTVPNLLGLNQGISDTNSQIPLATSTEQEVFSELPTENMAAPGTPSPPGKVLTAYFTAWSIYARGYSVEQVDASKLTHIHYAFANVCEDGAVVFHDPWADTDKGSPGTGNNLYGNLGALAQLKKKHRHVKISLSIGGWTLSRNFSPVAADAAKRKTFVSTSLEMLKNLALDGIDGKRFG